MTLASYSNHRLSGPLISTGRTRNTDATNISARETFAALLRQGPQSTEGNRTSPAPFDATGLIGAAPTPMPNAAAQRAVRSASSDCGIAALAGSAATTTVTTTPIKRGEIATHALWGKHDVRVTPAVQSSTANANAAIGGATSRLRWTADLDCSLRARPVTPQLSPRAHTSSVFVTLRSTPTSVCVFARPGRMAPTDQAKLRDAVSALLAEFGYCDAAIEFGVNTGETSWRK